MAKKPSEPGGVRGRGSWWQNPKQTKPAIVKPHMKNKQGESDQERAARLENSCSNCGTVIKNSAALQKHEDNCRE